MADLPAEDAKQELEAEVETTTYQADNWQLAHSSTPTSNNLTALETKGRFSEGAIIGASGGGRGNDSGGTPTVFQDIDGQRTAMNNSKNIFAQEKNENHVLLAQDQTENRAAADARLIQEIKDSSPFVAFGASGDLKQITAMVTGLGAGPVGVQPGGPQVTTGVPGISNPGAQLVNKGPSVSV